jgi:broad-specificity NMP kinase
MSGRGWKDEIEGRMKKREYKKGKMKEDQNVRAEE